METTSDMMRKTGMITYADERIVEGLLEDDYDMSFAGDRICAFTIYSKVIVPPQNLGRGGASRGRCAGGMGGGVHGRRDYAAHGTS